MIWRWLKPCLFKYVYMCSTFCVIGSRTLFWLLVLFSGLHFELIFNDVCVFDNDFLEASGISDNWCCARAKTYLLRFWEVGVQYMFVFFKGLNRRCDSFSCLINFESFWVAIGSPNATIGVSVAFCLAPFQGILVFWRVAAAPWASQGSLFIDFGSICDWFQVSWAAFVIISVHFSSLPGIVFQRII